MLRLLLIIFLISGLWSSFLLAEYPSTSFRLMRSECSDSRPASGAQISDASPLPHIIVARREEPIQEYKWADTGQESEKKLGQRGYADIREVDFANLSYVFALDGPAEEIPLQDGHYDASQAGGLGFMSARLVSRHICESEQAARPLAISHLRFRWGGGSSNCVNSAYLLSLDEKRLIELDRVSGDCTGGNDLTVDCDLGRMTLESVIWLDGDPHCCPSIVETSEYSFNDEHFELVSRSQKTSR